MKHAISAIVFSFATLTISANAAARSNCDVNQLRAGLQDQLNQRREYLPKRIESLGYSETIPSRGRTMIVAGNDDITYVNQQSTPVEVFVLQTKDLVSRRFFAGIVNPKTCQPTEVQLISDITE